MASVRIEKLIQWLKMEKAKLQYHTANDRYMNGRMVFRLVFVECDTFVMERQNGSRPMRQSKITSG